MAAITVQFEIGPKTLAMIERLSEKTMVRVELGPETRELIAGLMREQRGRDEA